MSNGMEYYSNDISSSNPQIIKMATLLIDIVIAMKNFMIVKSRRLTK